MSELQPHPRLLGTMRVYASNGCERVTSRVGKGQSFVSSPPQRQRQARKGLVNYTKHPALWRMEEQATLTAAFASRPTPGGGLHRRRDKD